MKKLLIISIALLGIAAGAYFYLTSRFNYLPEWYKQGDYRAPENTFPDTSTARVEPENNPEIPPAKSPETPGGRPTPLHPPASGSGTTSQTRDLPKRELPRETRETVDKINRELAKNEAVKISEAELDQLVRASVTEMMPGKNADFLKAVKSGISEEKIDVEMVVDADKIPWDDLPPKARLVQNLLKQMSSKSASELYVKISGAPVKHDDQLRFDDNSTIQVGKITYPLKEFLAMPGINQIIPTHIPLKNVPFNEVRLEKGFLVLEQEAETPQ